MSNLESYIKRLRLYSFLLFVVPTIALLGSLLLLNHLISFKSNSYPYGKIEFKNYECTSENNYCAIKKINFNDCSKYVIKQGWIRDGIFYHQFISSDLQLKIGELVTDENRLKKMIYSVQKPNYDQINKSCIKNSIFYPIYKKFPSAGKFYLKMKEQTQFGISSVVYPYLYGETSISNIVRRFPSSYVFKPLMYISTILMILYWSIYNKTFSLIEKEKRVNKFLIFGILSSIFLFLHIFFLGSEIDNSLFKKFRRLVIILFIFFELVAQFFLARRIFLLKEKLFKHTHKFLMYSKIIFVAIILLITIVAVMILILFDPGSAFNNILEWNYFLFLLLFYLLSALMWKSKYSE